MAFVFGLQTLGLIDFTRIFQLKGLKPKIKGYTNFYECSDLTKKLYLPSSYISELNSDHIIIYKIILTGFKFQMAMNIK